MLSLNVVSVKILFYMLRAYTVNSKLANARRHMRPVIYGDRVSMAGRWKF